MYIFLIYTDNKSWMCCVLCITFSSTVGSHETLHRDPGLDGVGVLHLLVLAGGHVPLLTEPEAVVKPGQEIQTVLHPGQVTQRTAG